MWYLQGNSPLGYKETTLNSPSIYVTAKKILLVIKLFLCAFNFNESFVINETKEQARTEKKKIKTTKNVTSFQNSCWLFNSSKNIKINIIISSVADPCMSARSIKLDPRKTSQGHSIKYISYYSRR